MSLWLLQQREWCLKVRCMGNLAYVVSLLTSAVLYPKIRGNRLISVETSSCVAPSRSCQQKTAAGGEAKRARHQPLKSAGLKPSAHVLCFYAVSRNSSSSCPKHLAT